MTIGTALIARNVTANINKNISNLDIFPEHFAANSQLFNKEMTL